MTPWLIAMAGLPASGKSVLAQRLATALPAAILDKDQVRAALFSPEDIEYSLAQDDFCVDILLQAASYLLARDQLVLLDGRPFSRRYQVDRLVRYAQDHQVRLKLIECTCPDAVLRQRLDKDVANSSHLAQNRDYAMYLRVKAQAEPITVPRLVVDTSQPLDTILQDCLDYIRNNPETANFG